MRSKPLIHYCRQSADWEKLNADEPGLRLPGGLGRQLSASEQDYANLDDSFALWCCMGYILRGVRIARVVMAQLTPTLRDFRSVLPRSSWLAGLRTGLSSLTQIDNRTSRG